MLPRLLPALVLVVSHYSLAFDLDDYRLVDLSHTYDENTLFWPTSPTFPCCVRIPRHPLRW